ncbi:hypothetical protein [Dysgonomonas sp. 511]|uniref:hypothetical protein n=1 Tax=Dysgonomonas sp. 511 TaxID=2302930 RepID=UPI0013D0ED89|nr:hypothetical protein [Dysgonomonas sp. 511]NDV78958.1 hypothetical protein [Dysgonomonas sp. 511]
MELIIQILMLFILINCILKLSFWKLWQAAIFSLICAVFIIWACQFAILQSKTQIVDYLKNTKIMQDAAVLITIESAICFAFCFAALREMFGKKTKRWIQPLYWYPSLLIFPVMFYLLTQIIFAMPGTDFTTISYLLAGGVLVGLPALSYLVRYLYPEKELRLEVYFLVSLFVCIIGLITTVNGNVTYAAVEEPVNIKALVLSFILFAGAFLIGFLWNKVKWIFRQKKELKNKNQLK